MRACGTPLRPTIRPSASASCSRVVSPARDGGVGGDQAFLRAEEAHHVQTAALGCRHRGPRARRRRPPSACCGRSPVRVEDADVRPARCRRGPVAARSTRAGAAVQRRDPQPASAAQPPSGRRTAPGTPRCGQSHAGVVDASSAWSRFRAAGQSIAPAWRDQAPPPVREGLICGPAAAAGVLGTTELPSHAVATVVGRGDRLRRRGTLDTPVRDRRVGTRPSGRKRSWGDEPTRRGGWALPDTPGLVPGRT